MDAHDDALTPAQLLRRALSCLLVGVLLAWALSAFAQEVVPYSSEQSSHFPTNYYPVYFGNSGYPIAYLCRWHNATYEREPSLQSLVCEDYWQAIWQGFKSFRSALPSTEGNLTIQQLFMECWCADPCGGTTRVDPLVAACRAAMM